MTPPIGTIVHVWPSPGQRVRSHGPEAPNRYLTPDGEQLPWSPWLQELHDQGHVHLTDPRGKAPAAPAPATEAPAAPAPSLEA